MNKKKIFRVEIPTAVKELIDLAVAIGKKHDEEGANSVLSFLIDLNWTQLSANAVQAMTFQTIAERKKAESAHLIALRNTNMVLIKQSICNSRDVLKGIYAVNQRSLADWGFNVVEIATSTSKNKKYKVVLPKNIEDLLILAQKIYQKHLVDGSNSPLFAMFDASWTENGILINHTINLFNQSTALKEESLQAYIKRDNLVIELEFAIRKTRDYLVGRYRTTPKILTDWSFKVITS